MNATAPPASPYKGLAPFEDSEVDALLFFGRERDREIVVANLLAARLTVLYGASGVGKSSLLQACVARRLREETGAEVVVFSSWTGDPADPLLAARAAAEEGRDVYMILDQFEEYFLYHAGEEGEGSLPAVLESLLADEARVHLLISVREDALALLDGLKARVPNILANCLHLGHLDREGGRTAITGPLERWSELAAGGERVGIEQELVEAVLDGAADRTGAQVEAPILQLVMERLWETERDRGSSVLHLATYEALGGAQVIVREHLELALEPLRALDKDRVAAVFDHLVTPSGSKIALRASDLADYAGVERSDLLPLLATLGRERILRSLDGSGDNGAERYEIFHDVLADAVLSWGADRRIEHEREAQRKRTERLLLVVVAALAALAAVTAVAVYALVERNRESQHARQAAARELEASALLGLQSGSDDSLALALRAARLEPDTRAEAVLRQALIESRLRRSLPAPGPVRVLQYDVPGRELLVAGGGRRLLLYDSGTNRLLRTFEDPATVTTASLGPAGIVVSGDADGRVRLHDGRTGTVLQALRGRGAVTSLAFGDEGKLLLFTTAGGTAEVWRVRGRLLRALPQPGPVALGIFDPAGGRVVTLATDAQGHSRAHLFDLASGTLVRVFPQIGVQDAEFSPDGTLLATGSHSGAVDLWSLRSGRLVRMLYDLGKNVLDLSFSPDGGLLATGSWDGATRIWRIADGTRLYMFDGHTGPVAAVTWSADGRLLADASADRTARLFAIQGKRLVVSLVATLPGNRGGTSAVEFSPDGGTLATGGVDGGVRLWDASFEERLVPLGFHRGPVLSAVYSSDSRLVVSAGEDGTARVWDVRRRRLLHVLRSREAVVDARFDPRDDLVVTASRDGDARIWRAADGSLFHRLAGTAALTLARFSPDGSLVVTGADDGSVRLWRTRDGSELRTVRAGGAVTDAAFSPDGSVVATTSTRGGQLWSVADGKLLHELPVPGGASRLAFSPDGRLVATADARATATLWDASTGRSVRVLRGHKPGTAVTDVEFSPDGKVLLTTGSDSDGRTWSVPGGAPLTLLRGQFGTLTAGAFNHDGRWIATAGPISSVIWSGREGQLLFYLRGHTAQLTTVSFSPLGEQVLTASKDGSVRTYDCTVCGDLEALEALAATRLARSGNGSAGS